MRIGVIWNFKTRKEVFGIHPDTKLCKINLKLQTTPPLSKCRKAKECQRTKDCIYSLEFLLHFVSRNTALIDRYFASSFGAKFRKK